MKFGLVNIGMVSSPELAVQIAMLAEEAGFESLWTVEHVVIPADYASTYPYSPTGRLPSKPERGIPDPLIWLTWIAAQTTTLKVATGVIILPQRNPLVLSKEIATLDALSGGRMLLGVGVGWLREEFDAIGVPFDDRGHRTDEYIESMRVLWKDAQSTYHGDTVSFDRVQMFPKPAQPGGVPIHIGGHSPAAARRAGRLGDGFFPMSGSLDVLDDVIGLARRTATELGRDASTLEVSCTSTPDLDGVRRHIDRLAPDRVAIPAFGRDLDDFKRLIGTFADEVISKH
jgi:probable F420-dependent oxidoreductase